MSAIRNFVSGALGGFLAKLLVGLVGLTGVITLGCWAKRVDQYESAVTKNVITGSVSQPVTQGFHIRPFASWNVYPIRKQQVPEGEGADNVEVLTADQLRLGVESSYWYRVDSTEVRNIYLNIGGPEAVHNYVYDAYRNATRDAVAEIAAEDLLSDERQGLGGRIEELMRQKVEGSGVLIEQYFLRDINPPMMVKKRIEEKVSRQQDVQTEKYQTEIEREKARQRRVEAAGIADAQDSIKSTLQGEAGLRYLQWRKYEMLGKIAEGESNATWVVPDELIGGVGQALKPPE